MRRVSKCESTAGPPWVVWWMDNKRATERCYNIILYEVHNNVGITLLLLRTDSSILTTTSSYVLLCIEENKNKKYFSFV